jgi:predicted RNA-binding Zn ribbon-like protein
MLNRYGDKKIKRRRAPRFELSGGLVCLDFVNTLDDRPSGEPKELLASYIDLARFGEDTGILDPHQVDRLFGLSQAEPAAAKHALAAAIQLREVIYEVFWAILNKKPAPAAALMTLNQYVQVAAEHSRLVEIGGHFEWRIETAPADFKAPLWPIARSAADLLASDQLEYVRACSSKTCQWLFLDTSKNHGRRWCDMKLCGNRAKFQRFYSRQKRSAFTTKDTKVHEGNR